MRPPWYTRFFAGLVCLLIAVMPAAGHVAMRCQDGRPCPSEAVARKISAQPEQCCPPRPQPCENHPAPVAPEPSDCIIESSTPAPAISERSTAFTLDFPPAPFQPVLAMTAPPAITWARTPANDPVPIAPLPDGGISPRGPPRAL